MRAGTAFKNRTVIFLAVVFTFLLVSSSSLTCRRGVFLLVFIFLLEAADARCGTPPRDDTSAFDNDGELWHEVSC